MLLAVASIRLLLTALVWRRVDVRVVVHYVKWGLLGELQHQESAKMIHGCCLAADCGA